MRAGERRTKTGAQFVQIAAALEPEKSFATVFALDHQGRVWAYNDNRHVWIQYVDEREFAEE